MTQDQNMKGLLVQYRNAPVRFVVAFKQLEEGIVILRFLFLRLFIKSAHSFSEQTKNRKKGGGKKKERKQERKKRKTHAPKIERYRVFFFFFFDFCLAS